MVLGGAVKDEEAPVCPNCGKPLTTVLRDCYDTDCYVLVKDQLGKLEYRFDRNVAVGDVGDVSCYHCFASVDDVLAEAGLEV